MENEVYPTGIKVFIDDVDITYFIFGVDEFTPNNRNYLFFDIDLSSYIDSGGIHKVKVTAGEGTARIDCRVEIS